MRCGYFEAGVCRSCTLLAQPYPEQVDAQTQHVRTVLGDPAGVTWLPTVVSAEAGFRNKAKMVVAGTVDAPTLGILDAHGHGVDLQGCPLYPAAVSSSFAPLAAFLTRARLVPYDVPTRTGELKHVLVTGSPDGELMVRFVLRSQEPVARIRKHLPWLQTALPQLAVASVNIQPAHAAVLEGDLEIVLTDRQTLPMRVDGVTLHLRPQSFFQTNTDVAAALYRQARSWVDDVRPASLWDLYCGVGGFALHCAAPGRAVTGVEISVEAIASATTTRDDLAAASPQGAAAMAGVELLAADATAFATAHPGRGVSHSGAGAAPELVIVNPPRRGIGSDLARWLEHSAVGHVLYSSCNATTLAKDLADMPSLRPRRARLLDMFPQTAHYEVLVLLERDPRSGIADAD